MNSSVLKVPKSSSKTLRVLLFIYAHECLYKKPARYGDIVRFVCEMNGLDYDKKEVSKDWRTGKTRTRRVYRGYWATNLTLGRKSILKQYAQKQDNGWHGWVLTPTTKQMLVEHMLLNPIVSPSLYGRNDADVEFVKRTYLTGRPISTLQNVRADDSINDGSGHISKTEVKTPAQPAGTFPPGGMRAGEVFVITGRPREGKSMFEASALKTKIGQLVAARHQLNDNVKQLDGRRTMTQIKHQRVIDQLRELIAQWDALSNELSEIDRLLGEAKGQHERIGQEILKTIDIGG